MFVGSFDQLACVEVGAGADEGDEVGCVDGAPALALRGQGRLHYAEGDLPAAERCLDRALRIAADFGLTAVHARVLDDLGDVHLATGRTDLAVKVWNEAQDSFVTLGSPEA